MQAPWVKLLLCERAKKFHKASNEAKMFLGGVKPLFIGMKSLGTPNEKDPNRAKFQNDTPLA